MLFKPSADKDNVLTLMNTVGLTDVALITNRFLEAAKDITSVKNVSVALVDGPVWLFPIKLL